MAYQAAVTSNKSCALLDFKECLKLPLNGELHSVYGKKLNPEGSSRPGTGDHSASSSSFPPASNSISSLENVTSLNFESHSSRGGSILWSQDHRIALVSNQSILIVCAQTASLKLLEQHKAAIKQKSVLCAEESTFTDDQKREEAESTNYVSKRKDAAFTKIESALSKDGRTRRSDDGKQNEIEQMFEVESKRGEGEETRIKNGCGRVESFQKQTKGKRGGIEDEGYNCASGEQNDGCNVDFLMDFSNNQDDAVNAKYRGSNIDSLNLKKQEKKKNCPEFNKEDPSLFSGRNLSNRLPSLDFLNEYISSLSNPHGMQDWYRGSIHLTNSTAVDIGRYEALVSETMREVAKQCTSKTSNLPFEISQWSTGNVGNSLTAHQGGGDVDLYFFKDTELSKTAKEHETKRRKISTKEKRMEKIPIYDKVSNKKVRFPSFTCEPSHSFSCAAWTPPLALSTQNISSSPPKKWIANTCADAIKRGLNDEMCANPGGLNTQELRCCLGTSTRDGVIKIWNHADDWPFYQAQVVCDITRIWHKHLLECLLSDLQGVIRRHPFQVLQFTHIQRGKKSPQISEKRKKMTAKYRKFHHFHFTNSEFSHSECSPKRKGSSFSSQFFSRSANDDVGSPSSSYSLLDDAGCLMLSGDVKMRRLSVLELLITFEDHEAFMRSFFHLHEPFIAFSPNCLTVSTSDFNRSPGGLRHGQLYEEESKGAASVSGNSDKAPPFGEDKEAKENYLLPQGATAREPEKGEFPGNSSQEKPSSSHVYSSCVCVVAWGSWVTLWLLSNEPTVFDFSEGECSSAVKASEKENAFSSLPNEGEDLSNCHAYAAPISHLDDTSEKASKDSEARLSFKNREVSNAGKASFSSVEEPKANPAHTQRRGKQAFSDSLLNNNLSPANTCNDEGFRREEESSDSAKEFDVSHLRNAINFLSAKKGDFSLHKLSEGYQSLKETSSCLHTYPLACVSVSMLHSSEGGNCSSQLKAKNSSNDAKSSPNSGSRGRGGIPKEARKRSSPRSRGNSGGIRAGMPKEVRESRHTENLESSEGRKQNETIESQLPPVNNIRISAIDGASAGQEACDDSSRIVDSSLNANITAPLPAKRRRKPSIAHDGEPPVLKRTILQPIDANEGLTTSKPTKTPKNLPPWEGEKEEKPLNITYVSVSPLQRYTGRPSDVFSPSKISQRSSFVLNSSNKSKNRSSSVAEFSEKEASSEISPPSLEEEALWGLCVVLLGLSNGSVFAFSLKLCLSFQFNTLNDAKFEGFGYSSGNLGILLRRVTLTSPKMIFSGNGCGVTGLKIDSSWGSMEKHESRGFDSELRAFSSNKRVKSHSHSDSDDSGVLNDSFHSYSSFEDSSCNGSEGILNIENQEEKKLNQSFSAEEEVNLDNLHRFRRESLLLLPRSERYCILGVCYERILRFALVSLPSFRDFFSSEATALVSRGSLVDVCMLPMWTLRTIDRKLRERSFEEGKLGNLCRRGCDETNDKIFGLLSGGRGQKIVENWQKELHRAPIVDFCFLPASGLPQILTHDRCNEDSSEVTGNSLVLSQALSADISGQMFSSSIILTHLNSKATSSRYLQRLRHLPLRRISKESMPFVVFSIEQHVVKQGAEENHHSKLTPHALLVGNESLSALKEDPFFRAEKQESPFVIGYSPNHTLEEGNVKRTGENSHERISSAESIRQTSLDWNLSIIGTCVSPNGTLVAKLHRLSGTKLALSVAVIDDLEACLRQLTVSALSCTREFLQHTLLRALQLMNINFDSPVHCNFPSIEKQAKCQPVPIVPAILLPSSCLERLKPSINASCAFKEIFSKERAARRLPEIVSSPNQVRRRTLDKKDTRTTGNSMTPISCDFAPKLIPPAPPLSLNWWDIKYALTLHSLSKALSSTTVERLIPTAPSAEKFHLSIHHCGLAPSPCRPKLDSYVCKDTYETMGVAAGKAKTEISPNKKLSFSTNPNQKTNLKQFGTEEDVIGSPLPAASKPQKENPNVEKVDSVAASNETSSLHSAEAQLYAVDSTSSDWNKNNRDSSTLYLDSRLECKMQNDLNELEGFLDRSFLAILKDTNLCNFGSFLPSLCVSDAFLGLREATIPRLRVGECTTSSLITDFSTYSRSTSSRCNYDDNIPLIYVFREASWIIRKDSLFERENSSFARSKASTQHSKDKVRKKNIFHQIGGVSISGSKETYIPLHTDELSNDFFSYAFREKPRLRHFVFLGKSFELETQEPQPFNGWEDGDTQVSAGPHDFSNATRVFNAREEGRGNVEGVEQKTKDGLATREDNAAHHQLFLKQELGRRSRVAPDSRVSGESLVDLLGKSPSFYALKLGYPYQNLLASLLGFLCDDAMTANILIRLDETIEGQYQREKCNSLSSSCGSGNNAHTEGLPFQTFPKGNNSPSKGRKSEMDTLSCDDSLGVTSMAAWNSASFPCFSRVAIAEKTHFFFLKVLLAISEATKCLFFETENLGDSLTRPLPYDHYSRQENIAIDSELASSEFSIANVAPNEPSLNRKPSSIYKDTSSSTSAFLCPATQSPHLSPNSSLQSVRPAFILGPGEDIMSEQWLKCMIEDNFSSEITVSFSNNGRQKKPSSSKISVLRARCPICEDGWCISYPPYRLYTCELRSACGHVFPCCSHSLGLLYDINGFLPHRRNHMNPLKGFTPTAKTPYASTIPSFALPTPSLASSSLILPSVLLPGETSGNTNENDIEAIQEIGNTVFKTYSPPPSCSSSGSTVYVCQFCGRYCSFQRIQCTASDSSSYCSRNSNKLSFHLGENAIERVHPMQCGYCMNYLLKVA